MRKSLVWTAVLAIDLVALSAPAQVVQLPTYRVFSVRTTVSIPDGGAAYLGGVTRGSWGTSSRGVPGLSQVPGLNRPFTNRESGSSVSSAHAYATATIIDHAEMDDALLAAAAARRGEVVASETDRRAAYLSKHLARHPKPTVVASRSDGSTSIGEHSSRIPEARSAQEAEMAMYLQRAERAETSGNLGAARCSYSVLVRRGSDEQKQLASRRLATLSARTTDDKLASREH